MNDRIYDQEHFYEYEPRYSPVEKNVNKRYVQTAFYCRKCDAMIKFLQIRCESCKRLIDWENIIDEVKE